MTSIGGPGGVGGPKGPDGPERPDGELAVEQPGIERGDAARGASAFDAIAADLAAGKLTAHEAVERMVDELAGQQGLAASERADLREMLTDLVTNDPYLSGLVGRA